MIYTGAYAWGSWGHPHINYAAVFSLPKEMRVFFYNHIDFLVQEAVIPDIRKYTLSDRAEYPRHYIDVEMYDTAASNTDNIPRSFAAIKAIYNDTFRQQYGILPWYVEEIMGKLTTAFKERRTPEILLLSADLAHYLGDANMPLHTSVNHDGQFTGQKGIHGFWESQLPEYFGASYNLTVGNAQYLDNVTAGIWDIVKHSHSLKDSLLSIEDHVYASYDKEKVYEKDTAGKVLKNVFWQPVHTLEYAAAYHTALNGMVERQMRKAVSDIARFWYTAWVNAGKPDLSTLDSPSYTRSKRKQYKKDYRRWQKGKLPDMVLFVEYPFKK